MGLLRIMGNLLSRRRSSNGGLTHNWGAFGGYRGKAGIGYDSSYDGPRVQRPNPLINLASQAKDRLKVERATPLYVETDRVLFDECQTVALHASGGQPRHWAKGHPIKYHLPLGDLPSVIQPYSPKARQSDELELMVLAWREQQAHGNDDR